MLTSFMNSPYFLKKPCLKQFFFRRDKMRLLLLVLLAVHTLADPHQLQRARRSTDQPGACYHHDDGGDGDDGDDDKDGDDGMMILTNFNELVDIPTSLGPTAIMMMVTDVAVVTYMSYGEDEMMILTIFNVLDDLPTSLVHDPKLDHLYDEDEIMITDLCQVRRSPRSRLGTRTRSSGSQRRRQSSRRL